MISIPINNYDFSYVKIRYESTKILSQEDLVHLANSLDIPTFRQRLLKFFPDLVTKIFPNLDSIHNYFTEDEILVNAKIIKNCPKSIIEFLIALFLLNFEIENIKTIIKSKSQNISYEEIRRDVHLIAERILRREKILKNLIYFENFSEIHTLFKGTMYFKPLKKANEYYEQQKSLSFFDIFLDYEVLKHVLACFQKLKKTDQVLIQEFMKLYLNFYNLKTIIRGKNLGFQDDFLKEVTFLNHVPYRQIMEIESVNDIVNNIKNNSNQSRCFAIKRQKTIEEILGHFRDFYHQKCLLLIRDWRRKNPFSIISPLSFLLKKRFLIEDIKFISVGIEYDMRPEDIIKRSILCREYQKY